ncbi:MAG TPA: hypothetical protein VE442_04675 [Jatrophihabitans sp.]|jgi:hypothetical protein|nr:hypothetical protein [Jatrophihabitans sp.]
MRYALGTESEAMTFSDQTISYGPSGAAHAIDTDSAQFRAGCTVAYAVCGRAVRVWQDVAFQPGTGEEIDPGCAAVTTTEQHTSQQRPRAIRRLHAPA